jgi:hypothetical protein
MLVQTNQAWDYGVASQVDDFCRGGDRYGTACANALYASITQHDRLIGPCGCTGAIDQGDMS